MMSRKQSWGLTARRHRTLPWVYALAGLGGVALFLGLHALVSAPYVASLHWTLKLGVAAAGVLGFGFSWVGAWRAHSADRGTKQLLSKLEETNKIVRESPRSYREVFDYHLLNPLGRAAKTNPEESKTHHMNLILSTPAYGYHVLGLDEHVEFQRGMQQAQCNKQIILFSPDAHFFHVANTILWFPLKQQMATEARDPQVAPGELASCVIDTMEILGHQVRWSQKTESPQVAVWTTDHAVFRLTSFEFGEESDAYVVLTDAVTLTSDLHKFNGRVLAIPDTLYRHLVGSHKDPDSFIEKIKGCPYTLLTGDEAKLRPEELEWLRNDYLLLRTDHVLFDLSSFDSQCRRLVALAWGKRDDLAPDRRVPEALPLILRGTVEYFESRMRYNPSRRWDPPTAGDQFKKLQVLQRLREIIGQDNKGFETKADKLRSLLSSEADRVDSWFKQHLDEYFSREDIANAPAGAWLGAIFYLLSSGFRESQFAPERRKRASTPMTEEVTISLSVPQPRPADEPQANPATRTETP